MKWASGDDVMLVLKHKFDFTWPIAEAQYFV